MQNLWDTGQSEGELVLPCITQTIAFSNVISWTIKLPWLYLVKYVCFISSLLFYMENYFVYHI